jgi:translation initiation factor 1A
MPKNKGKGGKKHKRGKKGGTETTRELVLKDDEQEYAVAEKMLGNSRIQLKCTDGKDRLGIIRGAMKKKIWIQMGDLVLVSTRDYQDNKADIIHKYTPDEVRILKKKGEVANKIKTKEESESEDDEESAFIFEDI